jgi:alpha-amylase
MITQEDIIYFVLTDRFFDGDPNNNNGARKEHPKGFHGGDFKGIEEKISYLKELGITAIWITPVYLSIGRYNDSDGYHGYWALDFEKVDPHLYSNNPNISNTRIYLKNLVDKLHENNIKVILDMVINHTGYHTQSYRDLPNKKVREEWFNKDGTSETKKELDGLPDINHDIPEVRDFFVNNIIDWIGDTGIDGIRMDTVKHVEDSFWHSFKAYVKGRYPNVTLIGEVLDNNAEKVARYQTLMDFDTLFDFPLRNTIKDTLVNEGPLTWLARPRLSDNEQKGVLDVDTDYYNNANRLITLLDNHDLEGRIKTTILNHVGHWDRDLSLKILKVCLAFQLTIRGIPQVYYGTEIGLEGGRDPWNRRDFRWEVLDVNYLARSDDNEAKEAKDIFNYVKTLIAIRKTNDSLMFGYQFTLYVNHFIFVYMREYRGNVIIVAINNGRERMHVPLTIKIDKNSNIPSRIKENCNGKSLTNLLDGTDSIQFNNGNIDVQLDGKEVKIYKL